jgi:hypothetical protein
MAVAFVATVSTTLLAHSIYKPTPGSPLLLVCGGDRAQRGVLGEAAVRGCTGVQGGGSWRGDDLIQTLQA